MFTSLWLTKYLCHEATASSSERAAHKRLRASDPKFLETRHFRVLRFGFRVLVFRVWGLGLGVLSSIRSNGLPGDHTTCKTARGPSTTVATNPLRTLLHRDP